MLLFPEVLTTKVSRETISEEVSKYVDYTNTDLEIRYNDTV